MNETQLEALGVKIFAANVYIADELTDETLAGGEFLTLQDFVDVCGDTIPGRTQARIAFNAVVRGLVATEPVEERNRISSFIDTAYNHSNKASRKEAVSRFLLPTQAVKDYYEQMQQELEKRWPATRKVIEFVLYDGAKDGFFSDFGEFMNRDQTQDVE